MKTLKGRTEVSGVWPGTAQYRNLVSDNFSIGAHRRIEHLLNNRLELEDVTALLLAGAPSDVPLSIVWAYDSSSQQVTLQASDQWNGREVFIARAFEELGDGTWQVEHAYFAVAEQHRGSGGAPRMLRASVEAYDALDVICIRIHANLELGGYVWAKLGFAPDDPFEVRARLRASLRDDPDDALLREAQAVAESSSNDELMYKLARLPDGGGKALLKGQEWYGHLDLTSARHRHRLASNLGD